MRRVKELAGRMVKQAVKKLARAAGKQLIATLMPVIIALWPLWLGLFLATLLFAGVYASMPENEYLAGVEQSVQDSKIKDEAQKAVDKWNKADIYIVSGEGSFYPGTGERVKGFMDRNGMDAALANKWGDVYSPVLYLVMMKNQPVDKKFPTEMFEPIAKDLHPYFYLKESTVTVTTQTEEGSVTSSYNVCLLVEAYTIRGHYQYHYEWVTETNGNTTRTYERLKSTVTVSKWERFEKYLQKFLEVPENSGEIELARDMVFNAGEGFSARKQWLEWLGAAFDGGYAWASSSMIPAELRPYFEEASKRFNIPTWLLAAVCMKESNFEVSAENKTSGAFGLMQVMPANWAAYAPQLGIDPVSDRDDPRNQIIMGAFMLASYGMPSNWEGESWKDEILPALTRYAGYGTPTDANKARCREEYANDVFGYADQFKNTAKIGWPVSGPVTSPFLPEGREHPVLGGVKPHNGIDIAADSGTPVTSVSGGIAYTGYDNERGNYISVKDGVYEYVYYHLSLVEVVSGQTVEAGQEIGKVGSTGLSTGPHLHFGVKRLDTNQWIDPLSILY